MAGFENNINEVLGDILTNNRGTEFIRVTKVTNKETGAVQYDVRTYYINEVEEDTPTYKGFRLKLDDMVELLPVLRENLEQDSSDIAVDLEDDVDRKELKQFRAGRDEIVISRIILKDKQNAVTEDKCIDARRWYYNEDDVLSPTKKGIRMKNDILYGVIQLIENSIKS